MKTPPIICIAVFLVVVNVPAEIEITDADHVFKVKLQAVSVPTQANPITKFFLNNADSRWEGRLSGVQIHTQIKPVTKFLLKNADSLWAQSLARTNVETKQSRISSHLFLHNTDSIFTVQLIAPTSDTQKPQIADTKSEPRVKSSTTLGTPKSQTATVPPDIAQGISEADTQTPSAIAFPPILSIEEIAFSESVLDAEETAKLSITLKNVGPGDARDVYAELSGGLGGLSFPTRTNFPTIAKNGGTQTVSVEVKGGMELPTAKASIDLQIIEPHFKVKIQGKRLIFPTRKFRNPELVLAKFAVLEAQSASPNNQIDINEMIDLKFAIQNVGVGDAENVSVTVETNPKGVMLLGVGTGTDLKRTPPSFPQIAVGKYETITYRYFVNSEFTDTHLKFTIKTSERVGKYGFTEEKSVPINTALKEEGYIRQVKTDTDALKGEVSIEDIPDFVVDVDAKIPKTATSNPDAVAVVIGNQDYKNQDVPSVDFALQDANTIKRYLIDTFGFREGNIIFLTNATQADFNSVFGTAENHKGKLFNYVKPNQSDVFVYYSGHGAPDPESKAAYFVPSDCDPAVVALNGYSLNTFYSNLPKVPYRSLTVVIDACFSGASAGGMLLRNISPVLITVENPIALMENSVVFTSATADQVSSWYPEKGHSLFTYYFLKALQGDADFNHNRQLTVGEIQRYIDDHVPYMARRLNSREQSPQVVGDASKVVVKY